MAYVLMKKQNFSEKRNRLAYNNPYAFLRKVIVKSCNFQVDDIRNRLSRRRSSMEAIPIEGCVCTE